MAYFWLYDGTNTLDIDATVNGLSLGGSKRNFDVIEFAGSNGGSIRGFGNYQPKTIIVTRKERAEGTDATAWNSRRNDLMKWFTRPAYQTIYFYVKDGEASNTLRTRVYCQELDQDSYKYYRVTENERAFKLISPTGYFENVTANTNALSPLAITSNTEQTITFTNNGNIECPLLCQFTPTANETSFQVNLAEGYGFKLEETYFLAGQEIIYDTSNGGLTINGAAQSPLQFLTAGSIFQIPPGSVTLYITCSGAGSFEYSFNERYI